MQAPSVDPTWPKPPVPPQSKSNTWSYAPRLFLTINAFNEVCQLLKTYYMLNIVMTPLNILRNLQLAFYYQKNKQKKQHQKGKVA